MPVGFFCPQAFGPKFGLIGQPFYKTKEGVSQRAMTLSKSLHTTFETDGATLNDGAKSPQMFESTSIEDDFSEREGEGAVSDYDVTMASRAMAKGRRCASVPSVSVAT